MEALLMDWLNLAVRWFHLVAGIAWIGASFYFIWLDLSLQAPPEEKRAKGIKGDLWSIHGGGIYEVSKYQTRPQVMPQTLHWFKWEAYSTWLSGSALLVLFYYMQADLMLVKAGGNLSSGAAIVASLVFIASGTLLYELLVRSPLVKRGLLFAFVLVLLITGASYVAFELFSARAALLHLGAFMGTVMAGNVFFGIMPAQRKFIAAVSTGAAMPESAMAFAKLRSTHNNYLTLPVLLCMIGNHSPFLYGHPHAWFYLVVLAALLAWGRHFFNLKHQGRTNPWVLVSAAVGVALLAGVMAHTAQTRISDEQNAAVPTELEIAQLVQSHCANCHATKPVQPGFAQAPAGLSIETPAQLRAVKAQALPAIQSGYMPLGNFSGLTDAQRAQMLAWLAAQ